MEMCFLWLRKPLSGFVTIVTLGPYSVNGNNKGPSKLIHYINRRRNPPYSRKCTQSSPYATLALIEVSSGFRAALRVG